MFDIFKKLCYNNFRKLRKDLYSNLFGLKKIDENN